MLCVLFLRLWLVLIRAGPVVAVVLALRDNDTSQSEDGGQAMVEGRTGELAIIITSQGCPPFGHPIVLCGFVSDPAPYALLPSNCSRQWKQWQEMFRLMTSPIEFNSASVPSNVSDDLSAALPPKAHDVTV